MSRHAVDRRKSPEGGRLKNFIEVEKNSGEEGTHPASKALSERPVKRAEAKRLREYVRIERGHKA
ncbi:hypothetical protein DEA8626_02696 [Defluviimonas aquaemixtae]|uniref:Uncharacterized protein n=1 Tax=Albidovulum aquaemixtae TaxID=1542388 RepID=A0A2R8BK14_9RHOB|nr:hypothetical protein [Defluviimonas aquaemixtae]SPH23630.1 hypothetical protein DEA8626_02696 [Defluviimonas aquaemixtae]